MEKYYTGMTGPPVDWLPKRDGTIIDPSTAPGILVEGRIKGQGSIKFTRTLSAGEVTIVADSDGNNRIRVSFGAADLDTAGIYQIHAVITWSDNTETSPEPYEFKVVKAWA